ncbi:MAG: 5'/3'-nucleotidase SurE [Paramuribaculum sp.]|nr:5'/3'-nucleotidase SurE [Paramuribaculum sp.]
MEEKTEEYVKQPQEGARPLIVLTNDDGIHAPGLHYLLDTVKDLGDIIVLAPDGPRSGQSSAITVNTALRIRLEEESEGCRIYCINGTPVDCVKLGMYAVVPRKPDLLLAGVNHGSNSGTSVIYSGTMGAVIEGCFLGIPSAGFSLLHTSWSADFSECGPIIREVTEDMLRNGLPSGICLNVNIPAHCKPQGLKYCRASQGYWTDEYAEYRDPNGRPFYFMTGRFIDLDPDDPETDNYWLEREWATAVRVRTDMSADL